MCFIFTCGETEFSSHLQGYDGVLCQCRNCVFLPLHLSIYPSLINHQGNYSASVVKRKPWFTFCFVPVVPLSIHGYEDVVCSICRFAQPLQNRPDVMEQARLMQQGGGVPMQPQNGPPQGWGGGGPGGGGPPKQQGQMMYR
jgi:hypothetical protein